MSKTMPVPAKCALLASRSILRLSGPDALAFLQGMLTQDVTPLTTGQPIFSAFLTPQGKYLADFFVLPAGGELWLDVEASQASDIQKRFLFFKTRANIRVDDARGQFDLFALWDGESNARGSYADPRLPQLGMRLVAPRGQGPAPTHEESDYREMRLKNGVAEGVHEIEAGHTLALEANFDRLHGVNFKKGCYMGQELTARTHFRALLKKRYLPFRFEGLPPERHDHILHNGFEIGKIQAVGHEYGLGLFALDKVRPFVENGAPLIHDGITFSIYFPPFLESSALK